MTKVTGSGAVLSDGIVLEFDPIQRGGAEGIGSGHTRAGTEVLFHAVVETAEIVG